MASQQKTPLSTIISTERNRRSWSQEQLAKLLGISRSAVSQIENGERAVSWAEAERLAAVFEVSLDYLAGHESAPPVVVLERAPRIAAQASAPERISVPHQNVAKFKEVLLYLLERCAGRPNVGETVINKLLYFADFDYFELYEEQLTGARYRKLQYGPVPLEFSAIAQRMIEGGELQIVETEYHGRLQKRYIPLRKPALTSLNGAEIAVLDSILDRFADKSARWMTNYSHEDIPWKATKEKELIDYELVFYRTPGYSVRDYGDDEE